MRDLAYSMLLVCASLAATLTASDTAAEPFASSSSVTSTERGTCAPEMTTVTPPSAATASISVSCSSSCSSLTFWPTCCAFLTAVAKRKARRVSEVGAAYSFLLARTRLHHVHAAALAALAAATKQHARVRPRRDAEERQSVARGEQAQKQKRPRGLHLFG